MRIEIEDSVSEEVYSECPAFPGHNLYHTHAWHQVLWDAFGWPVRAAIARDQGDKIIGFLPFVRKRRLGRVINVSLPLSHSIGAITRDGSGEIGDRLCKCVMPIEVHAPTGVSTIKNSGLLETAADLADVQDADAFMARLGKGIRRDIKDSKKAGVTVRNSESATDFDAFRKLQTATRRRQGAPDYPPRFFPAIHSHLVSSKMARVHLSEVDGIPVAGVVSLRDPDGATVYYGYGASVTDKDILKMRVNQAVLWDAISFAIDAGASRFSFGSTPVHQDALWKYKERFGGISAPIEWTIYGAAAGSISTEGIAVKIGANVLRNLPLPIFRTLSPILLKEVV